MSDTGWEYGNPSCHSTPELAVGEPSLARRALLGRVDAGGRGCDDTGVPKLTNIPTRAAIWTLALFLPMGLAACGGGPSKVDYARPYPKGLEQGAVADVQVFRRTSTLEFTNTTAKKFAKGTMWLNRRFSRPIDGIGVGETVKIDLTEFRDEYGQPFRPGGFFASEAPDVLALCQVEEAGEGGKTNLIGFVVVLGTGE